MTTRAPTVTRRLIAQITGPLAMLTAGPLADRLFEPAMRVGGAWSGTFGWLVGIGPGAGMGLLFVFTSVIGALAVLTGYAIPAIRQIETILPDYAPVPQPEVADELPAEAALA